MLNYSNSKFMDDIYRFILIQDNTYKIESRNITNKEINSNKFQMILESRGQISEYRVLYVACMNIIEKMKLLPKKEIKRFNLYYIFQ